MTFTPLRGRMVMDACFVIRKRISDMRYSTVPYSPVISINRPSCILLLSLSAKCVLNIQGTYLAETSIPYRKQAKTKQNYII